MGYEVFLTPKCMSQTRGQGFESFDLNSELAQGEKICPFRAQGTQAVEVEQPQDNKAALEAIEQGVFVDYCVLCGLSATWADFDKSLDDI